MNNKSTETVLVDYIAFIAPDKSLTKFEIKQEYFNDGNKLGSDQINLVLDIIFDDSAGGMRPQRNSRPDCLIASSYICDPNKNDAEKEYKFLHFTTTDEFGDHRYLTFMLFHINEEVKRGSRLESELSNAFDSATKTPFSSKMRTFFETKQENFIPIAICCLSSKPFFSVHKQFLVHLHDCIIRRGCNDVFRLNIPQPCTDITKEIVEEYYSIEFLISLFCSHLKIDESFEHAHIVLEKRRMSEIPLFNQAVESIDINQNSDGKSL